MILHGKLAFTSQLFRQIENALGSVSVTGFGRYGEVVFFIQRGVPTEGILHGEQKLPVGILQHQFDLPFAFGDVRLGIECIVQSV